MVSHSPKKPLYLLIPKIWLTKALEYHFLSKEYLEDIELSDFNNEVSIDNMYTKYKYEAIEEDKVKKSTNEVNGTMIGSFKNKKDMEAFKKMLKK